jgi:hypothetical protein
MCLYNLRESQRCVKSGFDSIGFHTMQSQELASLANISTQWLNKLLNRTGIPGVRRKKNGRLEIYDEDRAVEWASCRACRERKKPRLQRRRKNWVESGRTRGSREARRLLSLELYWLQEHGSRFTGENIPGLARRFGISKQALYQALDRADKYDPGVKAFAKLYLRRSVARS